RTVFPAVAFERHQLILEDQLRIVEQAADERGFAIVDGSAGQEAQHRLVFLRIQIVDDVARRNVCGVDLHQKYPSRFFFSIEPASSLSIRRPWRSEVRAVSISATIFSSVSASDSMAPVSG